MDESTIRIKCQNCGARVVIGIMPGTSQVVCCSGCGRHLVEFESIRGFIYVLSHPQMPNLVKIGFTTRQVEQRVAELNTTTAVPGPFVIEAVFPSNEPERHELEAHNLLGETRVKSKEFFKIALAEAIRTVSEVCGPASYLRTRDLLDQPTPRPRRPRVAREFPLSSEDETNRLREWQERMFKK
jgi:T5orf172 domain